MRILIAVVLAAGWTLSLFLPAVAIAGINDPHQIVSGTEILMIGSFGFLIGQFGWLANLTFLATVLVLATGARFKALGIALLAMHLPLLIGAMMWSDFPTNEGIPEKGNILEHLSGYYLWMAVMIGAVFAQLYIAARSGVTTDG